MNTPQHTSRVRAAVGYVRTAVGYVRVSTQEQASEGVSLDAQREKLRAYCKAQGLRLIDIKSDEGASGATLARPGLQAALAMLRRGRADTLIVVKLDRLSRSIRDVCVLIDELFSDERYHLLSLCGLANTHSAAGRMVLMNLMNFAQFEREIISERTRDALQHLRAQGVRLGSPPPFGYVFSEERDAHGRCVLVPLASEQATIKRMVELRQAGRTLRQIAQQLNSEGLQARRGGKWRPYRVSVVLERAGAHKIRGFKVGPRPTLRHDPEEATVIARKLRADGLSYARIGRELRKQGLTPMRGGQWFPAQVSELLRQGQPGDREAAAHRAAELRAQGMQLREIGVRLAVEGFTSARGGVWSPAAVHGLLSAEPSASPL